MILDAAIVQVDLGVVVLTATLLLELLVQTGCLAPLVYSRLLSESASRCGVLLLRVAALAILVQNSRDCVLAGSGSEGRSWYG